MRIIISGGDKQADFVIREFKKTGNTLLVINGDEKEANYLSNQNEIDVQLSDPSKVFSYREASIEGFDLIISLLEKDEDNFVACSIAKKIFGVKKAICTVQNPDNVQLFEAMGIDSPISASYLLAERIKGESNIDSLIKTLSLEHDKIAITEIRIKKDYAIAGKVLKDISFPQACNVCCIYRDPTVIIPRGTTQILEDDTLVFASSTIDQDEILTFVKRKGA
jgi:K+ transport systems, NAD-binding component